MNLVENLRVIVVVYVSKVSKFVSLKVRRGVVDRVNTSWRLIVVVKVIPLHIYKDL
jgi:hypothetical protein